MRLTECCGASRADCCGGAHGGAKTNPRREGTLGFEDRWLSPHGNEFTLPPARAGRLVNQARVHLMWAGRYPAPNRDEVGERDEADLLEHGTSLFRTPRTFNWKEVERIYSTANHCLIEIRIAHGLSRPDGSIVIQPPDRQFAQRCRCRFNFY
jgi:hypothetical protein